MLNNYLGGIGESFKEFVAKKIKGGFDNRRMPLDLQPATLNAEKNFERETDNLRRIRQKYSILLSKELPLQKLQLDQCLSELKERPVDSKNYSQWYVIE